MNFAYAAILAFIIIVAFVGVIFVLNKLEEWIDKYDEEE